MTLYFNAGTNGFYDDAIIDVIPPGSVEITKDQWQALMDAQSSGKVISSDAAGKPIAVDPPKPTKEQVVATLSAMIQLSLDNGASAWGYANMVTAASYSASTNAQFVADATALIKWRDDVWAWAIAKFPSVTSDENFDAFLSSMPVQPTKPVSGG